jgi:hypothetical protein
MFGRCSVRISVGTPAILRISCDLPQCLQTNAIRPQPLPSKSVPIQILQFDILYNPEFFVSALSSSKQHCPIVTCWPGELPVEYCMLATALFDVSSGNGDLTTELCSSAKAGACYVMRKRSQGPLNSCRTSDADTAVK